jgi:hypothetical protein
MPGSRPTDATRQYYLNEGGRCLVSGNRKEMLLLNLGLAFTIVVAAAVATELIVRKLRKATSDDE